MPPSSAPLIPSDLPLVDVHEPGAISRQHIERLHAHLSAYLDRLQPGIEAARRQYAQMSVLVLDHLIRTAPASEPRRAGLYLYLARPRSPLEWVRFPPSVNITLQRVAKARGVWLPSRHHPVPRDTRRRPSRAAGRDPQVYDWPWGYEDFRRRGVSAQPWEARLADDFEQAVAGPLRRAVRAVSKLEHYLAELRPVEEIQFDVDAAEAVLCSKLKLPRPDGPTLGESWMPDLRGPRQLLTPDTDPRARLALAIRLQTGAANRLRACAAEYTNAAKRLLNRLDSDRVQHWSGPLLAPRVLTPPDVIADPIIVWQVAKRGRPLDPGSYPSDGWRDLPWNNAKHRAQFRSYVGASSVRGQSAGPMSEFFWYTEAPRLLQDFQPAQKWERLLALYYDQHVITPLRRQWLLAGWIADFFRACVEPEDCRLQLDLDRYLPNAL
jgi:hypothetical protein